MVAETPAPASTLIPANCTIVVQLSKILCERLFERLTQTVTQTGIGAGSRQRNQRSGQQIILSQKGRKGQDSSFFPPPTYLHTQEVTGSSPVVSTTRSPRTAMVLGLFSVWLFSRILKLRQKYDKIELDPYTYPPDDGVRKLFLSPKSDIIIKNVCF